MSDRQQRANRFEIGQNTTISIDGAESVVEITNVSFGGILVESDFRPEIGTIVQLIDSQNSEMTAKVIRHTENGFALTMDQNKDAASFALQSITLELQDTEITSDEEEN